MNYGIALDIGTTTISGSLLDLEKKETLGIFSCLNGQLSHGHDIISRLNYAARKKNGAERLNESIISSINFVIAALLKASGVNPEEVSRIAAVGNAVISHFVFSVPVSSFAAPPYGAPQSRKLDSRAHELGIEKAGKARFTMPPNIGGFVGSDTIAIILATGIDEAGECALALDIGTNGEIVLGSKNGILVSSTAAGPAFEGWHISCGMRGTDGAIESAEEADEEIKLNVIGGKEPKGISGSGLIDLASILLKRGEIDYSGRLKESEFVVYDGLKKISLNQKDIREIQLAKAAFLTGTNFLRAKECSEIAKIYVTGTFGNYLNIENARKIGLIPKDVSLEKIEVLHQGALRGAEKILLNPEIKNRISRILEKTKHVSLAEDEKFQSEFTQALYF